MQKKSECVALALTLFSKYGCKRVGMDDVAETLGISKKTLYELFENKNNLVQESITLLLNNTHEKMSGFFQLPESSSDPFTKIIHIYSVGLKELRNLSPNFLISLKKYYPIAYKSYDDFVKAIVWTYVLDLLQEAKNNGQLRSNINIKLICELFLLRINEILLPNRDFFDSYTTEELLEHLIIVPLKGIKRAN
ncbi:TetR/AcrR family transcriptional regulator [Maribacter stanieri]|uniref:TetR/AcrR family transcriptional regulator n=1 Tax=Maribacter stanieri TaxID=440514 RepID=UPI0030DA44D0|tara:strand:- start:24 stop:602 length:579 start_codon:yes stop_codon:yes gene_type:complete